MGARLWEESSFRAGEAVAGVEEERVGGGRRKKEEDGNYLGMGWDGRKNRRGCKATVRPSPVRGTRDWGPGPWVEGRSKCVPRRVLAAVLRASRAVREDSLRASAYRAYRTPHSGWQRP